MARNDGAMLVLGGVAAVGFLAWLARPPAVSAREKRVRSLVRRFEAEVAQVSRCFGMPAPSVVRIAGKGAFADTNRHRIGLGAEWIAAHLGELCDDSVCDHGLLAFVAAHECAHLLGGHRRLPPGSDSRLQESICDFAAGWFLGHRGYPGTSVDSLLMSISPTCGEHPAGPQRIASASAGWRLSGVPLSEALRRHRGQLVASSRTCGFRGFSSLAEFT